jgi:putative ABC transport system ATP-binding protein
MLSIHGLNKSFGARPICRDLTLDVAAGEWVALLGESGTGKSTLLNLIAGLDAPDSGRIVIDGRDLGALSDDDATRLRRARIGFVFQAFHVLPQLSVAQNVALPLLLNGAPAAERARRVADLLIAVGLGGRGDDPPSRLSGGELQRVAIARALAHRPALLLADEPTGNLDPATAATVLALLRDQIKLHGAAGVMVTHSEAAARTADRAYVLTDQGLRPV